MAHQEKSSNSIIPEQLEIQENEAVVDITPHKPGKGDDSQHLQSPAYEDRSDISGQSHKQTKRKQTTLVLDQSIRTVQINIDDPIVPPFPKAAASIDDAPSISANLI